MEKKSERLEVRLGYEEKQGFVEACDLQGDNPSGAIRRFINGYIKRSDEDVLSTAWRGSLKRRSWRPLAFVAVFFAIGFTFWMLVQKYPIKSDGELFDIRDINGDGELVFTEHGLPPELDGSPNGVMRVLDLDNSETISRDEFRTSGRMAYLIETHQDRVIGRGGEALPMNVVEFEFLPKETKSGTFKNALVNAADFDRVVVWYTDGTATVMEGSVEIETGESGLTTTGGSVIVFPPSVKVEKDEDGSVKASRGQE